MIDAWIVYREEKHVAPKFWVCLEKDDAMTIATDVAQYWAEHYEDDEIDTELWGETVFRRQTDCWMVYVIPQVVREPGEHQPLEE
jgi:hypothetical protein